MAETPPRLLRGGQSLLEFYVQGLESEGLKLEASGGPGRPERKPNPNPRPA